MMKKRTIVGIRKETNEIVPIGSVADGDVGLRCHCICHDCKGMLEAVINTKRTKHFRHYTKKNCNPTPETELHSLAKNIILNHTEMDIPGKGVVHYSSPVCEIWHNDLIPDATIQINGEPLYIEIVVTNPINPEKYQRYKFENAPVLVIDLKEQDRNLDYDQLKKLVLQESNKRRMLVYHFSVPTIKPKKKNNWWLLLLAAPLIYGFVEFLKFRKN